MNYLYLITEDDNDDLFFESCLEELTGLSFQLDNTRRRLRKGGGLPEARRMLRIVLQELQRTGKQENTYLVITVDNDRASTHPHHETRNELSAVEKPKSCRFCELQREIEYAWGTNSTHWPVKVAIAVPVEMLESWLLLICGHQPESLPIFARKAQPVVARYYGPKEPTAQLKDLCLLEMQQSAIATMSEFGWFVPRSELTQNLSPHNLPALPSSNAKSTNGANRCSTPTAPTTPAA